MKNIKEQFKIFCRNNHLDYSENTSVRSYNDTTLFCPAGMQQYADFFKKKWLRGTSANTQSCLRVDDIEETGDGSHAVYFNMLGLFSFRELTMKQALDLWVSFVEEYLELKIEKITIHPKKIREWIGLVDEYITVETDNDCFWSDGNTSGYSMEMYVDGVEVGNIVNTEGDCIDAGFGMERLDTACNGTEFSKERVLKEAIFKIIEDGVEPGAKKQGYILRKLLNLCVVNGYNIGHSFFEEERKRIEKNKEFYEQNKEKYADKSPEWWFDTHGVLIDNK